MNTITSQNPMSLFETYESLLDERILLKQQASTVAEQAVAVEAKLKAVREQLAEKLKGVTGLPLLPPGPGVSPPASRRAPRSDRAVGAHKKSASLNGKPSPTVRLQGLDPRLKRSLGPILRLFESTGNKTITAPAVSKSLKISRGAASLRLRQAVNFGVLRRIEKGLYSV